MQMANNTTKVIEKVIEQARIRYADLMESDFISVSLLIDGFPTKGQSMDSDRMTTVREQNTKQMTCMLDAPIHRGSYVEIKTGPDDTGYSQKGIVITKPNQTPVDYYFSTLLFNTVVEIRRDKKTYNDDGDVASNAPTIIDNIGCFVQRISMRERQIDAGIDRNSVNQIITTKNWDIRKDDILYIGSDRYKVTDLEELDTEILSGYMTYYRE